MGWLNKRLPKKRWKRVIVYMFSTFFVMLAGDMALTKYWRWIDISPETTYLTSPLLREGTPDYCAWLNEKASEGVTPENNAAVPLMKAIGLDAISQGYPAQWREKALAGLGLPQQSWPQKLTTFVTWAQGRLRDAGH